MDPLSDDLSSQNVEKFFHEVVTIKRNSDAVLLNDDCDVIIKTEIKSETPFMKHLEKQIVPETGTCSNNWGVVRKTEIEQQTLVSDIGLKKERKFLPEDAVMQYKGGHEIEIKEEPWWLETETSSICDDIKEAVSEVNEADEHLLPTSPPRLTSEGVFQDGSGCCTSLTHSDSGQSQMGEVSSHFNTASVFTGTRPYKCDRCDKSFKWKSVLQKHIVLHSDIRPYKCDKCEKSFKWSNNLEQHIELHLDTRPYKCNRCEKSFKRKNYLVQHTLFHSDTRPYKCDRCEKSFKAKSHLEQHILLHSDTRPYKCNICEKSFKVKSSLVRHVVLHSNTDYRYMIDVRSLSNECSNMGEGFQEEHA